MAFCALPRIISLQEKLCTQERWKTKKQQQQHTSEQQPTMHKPNLRYAVNEKEKKKETYP